MRVIGLCQDPEEFMSNIRQIFSPDLRSQDKHGSDVIPNHYIIFPMAGKQPSNIQLLNYLIRVCVCAMKVW